MKERELTIGRAEKPARRLLCPDTELSDLFDISQVPEKRRHIYVYSLLLLYTLLVHTLRDFHGSGPTNRQSLMTSEVTRLIEADAVAKNLY